MDTAMICKATIRATSISKSHVSNPAQRHRPNETLWTASGSLRLQPDPLLNSLVAGHCDQATGLENAVRVSKGCRSSATGASSSSA